VKILSRSVDKFSFRRKRLFYKSGGASVRKELCLPFLFKGVSKNLGGIESSPQQHGKRRGRGGLVGIVLGYRRSFSIARVRRVFAGRGGSRAARLERVKEGREKDAADKKA